MINEFSILSVSTILLIFFALFNKNVQSFDDDVDTALGDLDARRESDDPHKLQLWLTISAQKRFLELSWTNAPAKDGDNIIITKQQPHSFEKVKLINGTPLARFNGEENIGILPSDGYTTSSTTTSTTTTPPISRDEYEGSGMVEDRNGLGKSATSADREYWTSNNGFNDIVAAVKPSVSSQWFTTGVPFDYRLSKNITIHTKCYGYWASYINDAGTILATACLRAYPRWMNEMRSTISDFRIRDLFIPGTHDSGSYRPGFDPLLQETLVTKYSLCQDDDVLGQLMHGVRYLDIRVGYYRATSEKFFINHGITRQRPLKEVIKQVIDFVLESNEIVIFGLKEFPVGFGKGLGVHRQLVNYLHTEFADLIVHPTASWSATLRDIWSLPGNVILAYDKPIIVQEHPEILFSSVDQRWGNCQTWPSLEKFLRTVNKFDVSRLSTRPFADMAELTPETFDVILDKYGGLRKMADKVNWRISQLYRDELGENANIVAADFIRGTTLVETAIHYNYRKVAIY